MFPGVLVPKIVQCDLRKRNGTFPVEGRSTRDQSSSTELNSVYPGRGGSARIPGVG